MRQRKIPRIMIAGTTSGCGKTTITCGLLQALVERGRDITSFKVGPDYIDPMFHRSIIGINCSNLDLYLQGEETMLSLLAQNTKEKELAVIEGVMGYYDGKSMCSTEASSYDIAIKTRTPVILVVDCHGRAISTLAEIKGYVELKKENRIVGVILNHASKFMYEELKREIELYFNGAIKVVGYLPRLEKIELKSRQLGLVTAQEVANLKEKLQVLAAKMKETVSLDLIETLAKEAGEIVYEERKQKKVGKGVRIGIAMDQAFCFYYSDNLAMLEEMGVELVRFSPLKDTSLPEKLDGIILGGGYPELYLEQLSNNTTLRMEIKDCLSKGLPCIAECGGFMYLTSRIGAYPMVGYFEVTCHNTGHLTRFGYKELVAKRDTFLWKKGERIPCHEFHYWDATENGSEMEVYKNEIKLGEALWMKQQVVAGFPHIHYYSCPKVMEQFVQTCRERDKNGGKI